MTNYLKNLGIGSRLAGAGIGVGISFTLNIALRVHFLLIFCIKLYHFIKIKIYLLFVALIILHIY